MNEQPVNNQSLDRRELRRQRRQQRRSDSPGVGTWLAGLLLIGLGVMFLLNNTTGFKIPFSNWWSLFLLLPAIAAFGNALGAYRRADGWTAATVRPLAVGIVLTLVTVGFLVGINWSFFGPGLIILIGVVILFNSLSRQKE